ncbi:MAG: hypothetical protein ACYC0C_03030 [Devosia sp.]
MSVKLKSLSLALWVAIMATSILLQPVSALPLHGPSVVDVDHQFHGQSGESNHRHNPSDHVHDGVTVLPSSIMAMVMTWPANWPIASDSALTPRPAPDLERPPKPISVF